MRTDGLVVIDTSSFIMSMSGRKAAILLQLSHTYLTKSSILSGLSKLRVRQPRIDVDQIADQARPGLLGVQISHL